MISGFDPSYDLLVRSFETLTELDFIVWLCPITAQIASYMANIFAEIDNSRLTTAGATFKGYRVFLAHRSKFVPKLLVREAVVEDNDDLLPILQSMSPDIVADQSEFFLAQLIQSQNSRNKILVGVEENRPVGMLAVSLDVNVDFIKEVYDLTNFDDVIVENVVKTKSPHMLFLVCGNLAMLDDNILYNLAIDFNCVFIDADDVLDEPDEINPLEAVKLLKTTIEKADKTKSCILTGFPRTLAEADAFLNDGFSIDIALEVKSIGGKSTGDDVSAVHIAAVEYLRSACRETQLTNEIYWKSLNAESMSESEVVTIIESEVKGSLRAREYEIYEMTLQADEGPRVNYSVKTL